MIVLAVFLVGTSYALWQITLTQESTNVVTAGCFNIEFQDNNPITLENAVPITDDEGSKLTPYSFTLTNTCDTLVKYQINLEVLDSTTLNNEYVKTKFEDKNPTQLTANNLVVKTLSNTSFSYNLDEGVLSKKGSKTFNLRLWLNETTEAVEDAMNKVFESKIVVNTVQSIDNYTEDILNGADPVLKTDLIPVTIDNDRTVKKADTK